GQSDSRLWLAIAMLLKRSRITRIAGLLLNHKPGSEEDVHRMIVFCFVASTTCTESSPARFRSVTNEPRWGEPLVNGMKPLSPARRGDRSQFQNKVRELTDAVEFARERLEFHPDAIQEMVLRGGRRGIVNCTRQWGKSSVTAVRAVHR